MWKMTFEISIISLRFETPWVRKNSFYGSKSKNLLKKSTIWILVTYISRKSLLIIPLTFFD